MKNAREDAHGTAGGSSLQPGVLCAGCWQLRRPSWTPWKDSFAGILQTFVEGVFHARPGANVLCPGAWQVSSGDGVRARPVVRQCA